MIEERKNISVEDSMIDISMVIPLYNEVENIAILHSSIKQVLDGLNKTYEVIYIDDGSTDGTFEHLKGIADKNSKVIKFRRNFGQSAAMAAGFEKAQGEVIISMDGDLQNDPKDISMLLEKLDQGYDVVSGWRKHRKDKMVLRKIPSKIANRIICSVTKVKLHDTGCSLKAYRREIVKRISLHGELHRFIPALAKIEGAQIAEMVVHHHPRRFGKSKYNITRTFKVIMDLITLNLFLKYLRNPLHFFGILGLISVLLGGFTSLWIVYRVFAYRPLFLEFNVLITLIFLLMATGIHFLVLGLLAKLIVELGQRKGVYLIQN